MLLAVDKPKGITSYDAIRRLKRIYPKQKIWHSGTLDPLATGLLLIGVGKGTKLLTNLQWLDKIYIAEINFAKDSDTRDVDYRDWLTDYEIKQEKDKAIWIIKDKILVPAPTQEQIIQILNSVVPSGILPLTPFSAKKKNGKKLYDLARAGKPVKIDKEMTINSFEIIKYDFPTLEVKFDVGSGTYIRSIAHRLWQQFKLWGILTGLRRLSIGKYKIENFKMEKIENSEVKIAEVEL